MLVSDLKNAMDKETVIKILHELGCEKIKAHKNYVSSTKGNDSDNATGVVVYLDSFKALMPTTPQFEKYPIKDIFAVIQEILKISFPASMKFVCDVVGIQYKYQTPEKSSLLTWLATVEHGQKNYEQEPIILPDIILDQFIDILHENWSQEGISEEIQKKFKIGFDVISDSITIPIISSLGELIGIKCRSLVPDAESKYWYMYPCEKSNVLYGLYQNYSSIQEAGSVIVFEAEKSVLKSCSYGIHNCVAIAGKVLAENQIEELIRLGVDIILAFDKDVSQNEIDETIKRLAFPVAFNSIYVLKDDFDLFLDDKDSPADSKDFMLQYSIFKEKII